MAVQTTKTSGEVESQPVTPAPTDPVKKQIHDLYIQKGSNLYAIAEQVFGFSNEDAVRRVYDVVTELFPEPEE